MNHEIEPLNEEDLRRLRRQGIRLVRMSEDVVAQFGTRSASGDEVFSFQFKDPDRHGISELRVTSTRDDLVSGLRSRLQAAERERDEMRRALPPESPTRPWVLAFAREMEAQLAENRHKGDREGWARTSAEWLLTRLKEEVRELEDVLARNEPCGCRSVGECWHNQPGEEAVRVECADVANFALMIADVAGGMEPVAPPAVRAALEEAR